MRLVCFICDWASIGACKTYTCGPCGEVKRKRIERVIEDGLNQHLTNGRYAYFLTVTAPGDSEHKRWYERGTKAPRGRPACECHDHGMTVGVWNAQASKCWNRMRTGLTRNGRDLQFIRAVEPQDGKRRKDGVGRGLLHNHVIVVTTSPLRFDEVQAHAIAAGFGCVVDLAALTSAGNTARYLSKYVPKSAADRFSVPWVSGESVDQDTGELTERTVRATFRPWSSSRGWGVTLAHVVAVARAQAISRANFLRELQDAADAEAAESGLSAATAGGPSPP